MYDKLDGRYYLAFDNEGALVAMTGLNDTGYYNGLEVDWTCCVKEHSKKGLISRMLQHLLISVSGDVYCSCWRWNGHSINLKYSMEQLGFKPVLEPRTTFDSRYSNCKRDCAAYFPVDGICTCHEDLYVREIL